MLALHKADQGLIPAVLQTSPGMIPKNYRMCSPSKKRTLETLGREAGSV